MLATAPRTLPSDLRQLSSRRPERPVPFVQGTYYLLIGLWPILADVGALAGSETGGDTWQLRAFGLVVAVVGVLLILAARRCGALPETARLGVVVALGLAAADVVLVQYGTAPTIYLADAVIQFAFVLWWGRGLIPHDPELVGRVRAGLV
jgi:hypothetical protein